MNKEKFLNWIKANKKGVGIIGVALAVIILIGGGYSIYRYTNKPLQVAENKESDTLLKQEETAEGTSDKADENIDGKKDNEESGQVDSQENKSEDKTNNNEKTDEKSNNGNGVASAGNSSSSKGNNQASSSTGGNGSNKQTGKPSGTSSSSSNGGQSKPNTSSSSKPSGNGNTSTSKPSKPNKPSTNKPSGNVNKPNTNNKPSKPQRTWQYMSSLSQQTFNALNNYRTSHGVKALKYSSSEQARAKSQAEYNVKNKNNTHDALQISYKGNADSSASGFIQAWANSAGHKKSMLRETNVEGAVAVYKDSEGYYYVVASFGNDW